MRKPNVSTTDEEDNLHFDYDFNLPYLETMYVHDGCNILPA